MSTEEALAQGLVERIGIEGSILKQEKDGVFNRCRDRQIGNKEHRNKGHSNQLHRRRYVRPFMRQ